MAHTWRVIMEEHRASMKAYKKVHNETVRSGLRMAIVQQSMEMDMWEIKEKLVRRLETKCLDYARKCPKMDFNSWAIYEEVILAVVNDKFRRVGETMECGAWEQVHGCLMITSAGNGGDLFVGSSLISFYGKVGCFEDGDMVFDQIGSRRNVVVWTARIINNCKEERFREVFEVFNEMGKEGVRKNSFTLSSVLFF
ncbi:pentatricopeptide repeat-containing protein [Tanacetum coccineum]